MKKKLMKSKKRAILAGVCAGLGDYCNISPWVFRALLLALIIVLKSF
ncbi:MAG: PspC domain-containing protein, partial [Acetobacterium sp.]|nr:PspC domain-containing protein [Acetobacterium sp.]